MSQNFSANILKYVNACYFFLFFQGFVRVICHAKCKIEFHYNCWKEFKSKMGEKIGDKVFVKCHI